MASRRRTSSIDPIVLEPRTRKYRGITAKNPEQEALVAALIDPEILMVTCFGPAGTGKTIISLAVALQLINEGKYDKLMYIKPLIPVGGKDLGFVPGSKFEKVTTWLGCLTDNLEQLTGMQNQESESLLQGMVDEGLIECECMTYIQGRSIVRTIIILDEVENLSIRETRMAAERCAHGSKIVLLGDPTQIENPKLNRESSGLTRAAVKSTQYPECAVVELTQVERSRMCEIASQIFS